MNEKSMEISDNLIRELLLGPDRDLHLVAIIKQWELLNEDQKHDLVHLMSKYVLENQVKDLRAENSERGADSDGES